MSFDGLYLKTVLDELRPVLVGQKVSRIHQPEPKTILIQFRRGRLLLSAKSPRLHLTEGDYTNPPVAPNFCMILRKHLERARLTNLEQRGLDRVVDLSFDTIDELGNPTRLVLAAELTGRHANLVLVNSGGTVIDALVRLPGSINAAREILPGRPYVPPPTQDKLLPREAGRLTLEDLPGGSLKRSLQSLFDGLGPDTAREIAYRLTGDPDAPASSLKDLGALTQIMESLEGLVAPEGILDSRRHPVVISPIPLGPYIEGRRIRDTANALADRYFLEKGRRNKLESVRGSLLDAVSRFAARCERKIERQERSLELGRTASRLRREGEILMANLHRVRPGQGEVTLEDFEDGSEVNIKLNPKLSPVENAQGLFRRYQKAKKTHEAASKQLEKSLAEKEYLENLAQSIEQAESLDEMGEIREELVREGYLRERRPGEKRGGKPSGPKRLRTSSGKEILVGRNNRQNDLVTMRLADPSDLWFHVKDIPGSHVILRTGSGEVAERDLLEAAAVAAYYSKGRSSSNVPVDYTERKNVWKPKGAKPGMVLYEGQKTLFVTPDPDSVLRMEEGTDG